MGPRAYYGYCPLGALCRKGNSALCRKDTRLEALDFVENHLLTSSYHQDDPKISENLEDLMKAANGDICCWSDPEDGVGKGREILEGAVALEAKAVRDARRAARLYTPEPDRKGQLRLKDKPAGEAARHEARRSRSREARVRSRSSSETSRARSRQRDRKERSTKERTKKDRKERSKKTLTTKERTKTTARSDHGEAPAFSKAPSVVSALPPSLALTAPMPSASSSCAEGGNEWVRLPKQELVGVHEALVRAQRSTQHAARVAHAAGQAFDAESINLEHCKLVVERALMRGAP